MVDVKCPKCGWEFHAETGAIKAICLNPSCEAPLLLSKKGAEIDAHRSIVDADDRGDA